MLFNILDTKKNAERDGELRAATKKSPNQRVVVSEVQSHSREHDKVGYGRIW